jgi:hypothetical protein
LLLTAAARPSMSMSSSSRYDHSDMRADRIPHAAQLPKHKRHVHALPVNHIHVLCSLSIHPCKQRIHSIQIQPNIAPQKKENNTTSKHQSRLSLILRIQCVIASFDRCSVKTPMARQPKK